MSAEILRDAAALMRKRARAATEVWGVPTWEAFDAAKGAYDNGGRGTRDVDRHHVATADEHGSVLLTSPWDDKQIVHHAASWHPAVALAVAEWLDRIAWTWDLDPDLKGRVGGDEALAVAHSYLGRDS